MFSGVEKAAIGRFSSTGTWLGTFLGDLLGTSPGELLGTSLGKTALSDPSLFPDFRSLLGLSRTVDNLCNKTDENQLNEPWEIVWGTGKNAGTAGSLRHRLVE